jgi:hypothetical protein
MGSSQKSQKAGREMGIFEACQEVEEDELTKWTRAILLQKGDRPILTFFPSKETVEHISEVGELDALKLGESFVIAI